MCTVLCKYYAISKRDLGICGFWCLPEVREPIACGCWGITVQQTGWFRQHNFIVSLFRSLEIQIQGVSTVRLSRISLLGRNCPIPFPQILVSPERLDIPQCAAALPLFFHDIFSLCVYTFTSSSYKDTCHMDEGLSLVHCCFISINFTYDNPISK